MYKVVGSKGVIDFIGFKDTEEAANELARQWQAMGLSCVVTKELP